jgi:GntR family transcriptional regulator, transcriptional repressor for pyruvate dehydrogenase complex
MTSHWRPVGSRSVLHARVAEEIERLIRARQLRPGDRLPTERELAQILQVGRSSLREAIAVLTSRGVLRVKRGHGIYVGEPASPPPLPAPALERDELRQLFDMREVLEVAAAGWAAHAAGDDDIAALRATIAALDAEASSPTPDLERLQELDTDFHLLIAAMARNRFLAQTTQILHQMLAAGMETTLVMPGRVRRSRQGHLRVGEAIASHDVAGARAAMQAHIREVRDAALRRRAGQGSV